MRCWHQDLIPKLCRQHLLAMWRECNGMLKIIYRYQQKENKIGYINHPATQEFINKPSMLVKRLLLVRKEMINRGYNPKLLPIYDLKDTGEIKEWQDLKTQIEKLKEKGYLIN